MLTCVFQNYAEEARPYRMVLALVAFAMVCYQRSRAAVWVVLFAMSLALAEALHYLAVLAMAPFGVAELFESWRIGKIRWGIWAALVFGALPLALFWNLLRLNKAYYGAHHYYGHFALSSIPGMYAEFFGVNSYFGGAIGLTALAAIAAAAAKAGKEGGAPFWMRIDMSEAVLLFSFAALPFFAFVFTKATHSGMTSRYVLSTVLGLLLALEFCLARASKRAVLIAAVFVTSAAGINELRFWRFEGGERQMVKEKGAKAAKFIEDAGYGELPVVVPNGGTLLAVVYYALPKAPQRFVFLQGSETAGYPDAADTAEKGLQQVQLYVGIQVRPQKEFLSENRNFLVYVEGLNADKDGITVGRLKEDGQST
jgi:hypothetical protein